MDPAVAGMITAAALATYLVVPFVVPAGAALLVAQAALAVVPVTAVLAARAPRPAAALGLGRAPARFALAAVLIGATAWYVNVRLVSLLPLPVQKTRALEALVDRPSLAMALIAFALAPAVCEEILFRGVLARGLARHLRLVVAAAVSAVVFAAYHVSVVQALPTLSLGFVLGLVAIRADSALPTMLAHAINNALAIALSRGELPWLAGWLGRNDTLALAGCAAATAAGIALAVREPQ